MTDVCKNIDKLLKERGISGVKMSADLGMSRSFMTELRKGRAKSIKIETAQKIADYFGVSVESLLGTETEKAPAPEDERKANIEDVKIALFGGDGEVTDEMWEEALFAAEMIKERYRRKKGQND